MRGQEEQGEEGREEDVRMMDPGRPISKNARQDHFSVQPNDTHLLLKQWLSARWGRNQAGVLLVRNHQDTV